MLEKILLEVCQKMSETLSREQLEILKNTLFISFHGKKIAEEKCEIVVSENDTDLKKMQIFYASKKIAGRKDSTLKQYINELKICRDTINKKFEDITTMDLRWYLGMMQQQRGNKISTIQNKIRYLNSFYSFLVKEEMVSKNPVSRIETPKMDYIVRKPFSVEEMEAIRKNCVHPRDRALIEFLYSTGVRVSELCSLNVGDINMHEKEFIVKGKGNKERTVYFSDSAYFHLSEYLKWRVKEEGMSLDELSNKSLFVSTRKPHNRTTKSAIENLCRTISKKSGVLGIHPHRFRRTFATNMMNRDMKLEELMKLMGHSKMDTTLIYCTVGQENVKNSYRKCA